MGGKTSSQSKNKYNKKAYARIVFLLDKTLVNDFKEKCKNDGVTQASVIREAMLRFLFED